MLPVTDVLIQQPQLEVLVGSYIFSPLGGTHYQYPIPNPSEPNNHIYLFYLCHISKGYCWIPVREFNGIDNIISTKSDYQNRNFDNYDAHTQKNWFMRVF